MGLSEDFFKFCVFLRKSELYYKILHIPSSSNMLLTEIQVQNIKMFLQVTLLSLEKLICDNDLISIRADLTWQNFDRTANFQLLT